MDYTRIYNTIIERAKTRETFGYKERHHIIPRSLGGSDDKDNLVDLTAREHFLCHYLLTKMYEKETVEYYKMLNAFIMMKCSNELQDRYINSHLYESKKIEFSEMQSEKQTGKGNSQYGKIWIHNLTLKKSKKVSEKEFITLEAEGWLKGRRIKFDDIVYCKDCGKEINSKNKHGRCQKCLGDTLTHEQRSKGGSSHARASEKRIIEVLRNSSSFKECMLELGYKGISGNAFKRVKRIAEENNIEF